MTNKEKREFRYTIVQNEMKINFAEANFFAMPMHQIWKLNQYAEIFGIKGRDKKVRQEHYSTK